MIDIQTYSRENFSPLAGQKLSARLQSTLRLIHEYPNMGSRCWRSVSEGKEAVRSISGRETRRFLVKPFWVYYSTGGTQLEDWQMEKIRKGREDALEGRLVPHEDVMRWLDSLGTDDPLPMPLAGNPA